ncbi:MAG: flagellar biosynthesis protein FliQ [Deltaproteobacteria bacterium]|nr:flagellar biosynthesis protein FliQ [Deltaproteobacteria bacterium]
MTPDLVTEIIRKALYVVLLCSAPMLLASLIVGVLLSIFQTVTSIQEPTLVFVPKIVSVFLALAIFFPWITNTFLDFARWIFEALPTLAK